MIMHTCKDLGEGEHLWLPVHIAPNTEIIFSQMEVLFTGAD